MSNMSKKSTFKKSPRKFSDKIALIKQKEAMTNACFESAIQSLSEISMNPEFTKATSDSAVSSLHPTDVYQMPIDVNSKSCSPASFISNSSGYSRDSPTSVTHAVETASTEIAMRPKSNQQPLLTTPAKGQGDCASFQRRQPLTQSFRHSNVEGYNSITNRPESLSQLLLQSDRGYSGSMPNVTVDNSEDSGDRILATHIPKSELYSDNFKPGPDSINIHEALSNLQDVKMTVTGKKAIWEHLKNKGVQNSGSSGNYPHPHHVSHVPAEDKNKPLVINNYSSPPLYRKRMHNTEECSVHMGESNGGIMKHYTVASSPYKSVASSTGVSSCYGVTNLDQRSPQQQQRNTNDLTVNLGGISNMTHFSSSSSGQWQPIDTKATSNSGYWFGAVGDYRQLPPHAATAVPATTVAPVNFLNPSLSDVVNDNWRRASSDSSLQNSLRYVRNTQQLRPGTESTIRQTQQQGPLSSDALNCSSCLVEHENMTPHNVPAYHRIQSLNSCPLTSVNMVGAVSSAAAPTPSELSLSATFQSPDDQSYSQQHFFQSQQQQSTTSQLSTTSSFLDRILDYNSPRDNSSPRNLTYRTDQDENMDPNILYEQGLPSTPFTQPDSGSNNAVFPIFPVPLNTSNTSDSVNNTNQVINEDPNSEVKPMESSESTEMVVPEESMTSIDLKLKRERMMVSQTSDPAHQCWWAQSKNPATQISTTRAPILPCDNLDPKQVTVDPNTDFSCIPEIILNDFDVERRDSLNWTDEYLNNLPVNPITPGNFQTPLCVLREEAGRCRNGEADSQKPLELDEI